MQFLFAFCKYLQIFAIHFAERKKSGKKCGIFCRAQKILQKLAQKQTRKIYDNRKYLQYILRIAKISVNISDIFCKSQKIPLKIPQKKRKKLMASIWRNSEKCREIREMSRNVEKCREMQICMTFMTHGNVIFDILEPPAFRILDQGKH